MLDAKLIMSEDQANILAQASYASTDIIDVGAYEDALGEEEHLRLRVEVSKTCVGAGGTLKVEACHDTVAPIDGSSVVWAISDVVPVATLKAGYCIMDVGLPVKHGRILGVYYTVATADFTDGTINAYVYAR